MTWLKNNSYTVARMLIYQFGIAILGIILSVATATRLYLMLMVSIYAVLFYVILLYMMTWEDGAKEGIRDEAGITRVDRLLGLKLSLVANIPNFLITLLLLVGHLFGAVLTEATWAQTTFVVAHGAGAVWESMYLGIINTLIPVGNSTSYLYIIAYALTPLPSIGACTLGYLLGSYNKRIFGRLTEKKKS